MNRYLYLLVFISIITGATGQSPQPDIWCFGDSAQISFQTGQPVCAGGRLLNTYEGTDVACDRVTGQLLFYTDGINVWNRNNGVMPGNTMPLGGNVGSTQSAFIVAFPNDYQKYYLFTTDAQANYYGGGTGGLSYSIIDMALNGGLGDVAQQPRVLLTPTTEKLTGTIMANKTGAWVLCHQWNTDAFYDYPVTAAGIGAPVISHIGLVHNSIDSALQNSEAIGYMKISPDEKLVAVATGPHLGALELFRFDNSTGKVGNLVFTDTGFVRDHKGWQLYGVCFSPNSKVLYVSYQRTNLLTNYVLQYDLTQATSQAMIATKDSFESSAQEACALKLAPDGRIYVAIASANKSTVLDRINNPNVFGPGCNYQKAAVTMPAGTTVWLGLPNDMDLLPLLKDSIAVTVSPRCNDSCGASATAKILDGYPPYIYSWSGSSTDSTIDSLCYGTYYVTITDYIGSQVKDSVTITPSLSPPANAWLTVNGDNLTCNNAASVQWYMNNSQVAGATSLTYNAPGAGIYMAQGTDVNGCDFSDTVTILSSGYFFPNAFTPNGDGVNDVYFPVLQPGVSLFSFRIFDRWGELIYDDHVRPWDGKYKGVNAPEAVYVYEAIMQASDLNNATSVFTQKVKGSITLIR